ncbi:MAG: hypothetical protein HYX42_04055 [Polaromonas sp.]|uniref:portal protein n=1 Tax=Polaromonas sp. TaxID=1869339 RepID=UPI0025F03E78|nr:portal protein [Polaromonas sp.]MBI2725404.1 hypothetical protein [Polaromonas sp.]
MAQQDSLQRARERYDDAADAFRETRAQMLEDLKFSNPAKPEQWPADALKAREGRPCLTFDQTNQYIAQIVNDSRQNKPSIYCLPSDAKGSVKVAQALEGLVRNIEYTSRAGITYDTALEHAARIGLGWMRVIPEVIDDDTNEQQPRIIRVQDPLSVLLDADSTEPDGSDATDAFVETIMSKKAFERQWPKASTTSWESTTASGWFTTDSVRVCEHQFVEISESNRIMVRNPDGSMLTLTEDEYWQLAAQVGFKPEVAGTFKAKHRTVKWNKMTGAETLEETEFPSEYLGVVPVIGYELWIEGKRHLCGMVRRMRDSQQAYNYERSSQIETVALQPKAPFVGSARAIEGYENEWKAANTSNQAILPFNDIDDAGNPLQRPERSQPPQMSQAFAQGGLQAINDLQASIGMYKSNLGAPSNAVSGRAKIQDRREGDTANFHYADNQSRSIEQLGRVVVDMTIRLTDTKRAARILNLDGSNDTIIIDPTQEKPHQEVNGKTSINLSSGKYGVRVKSGPAYSTLREEAAENLTKIVGSNPQMMTILGPMWAKMQDWPEADKISRMLMAMAPPQVQAAAEEKQEEIPPAFKAQLTQYQQQISMMSKALEAAAGHAEQLEKEKESSLNDQLIKAYEAETKRITAVSSGMQPEQVHQLVMQTMMQVMQTPAPTQGIQDDMQEHEQQEQMQGMPPPDPMQPPQQQPPPDGGFFSPEQNPQPA